MKAPLYHTRTVGAIQPVPVRMILSYLVVLVNVWQSVLADSDACMLIPRSHLMEEANNT
jgi:hypothetical protein